MKVNSVRSFFLFSYTIIILSMSLFSPSLIVNSEYIYKYDKIAHLIEFFFLGILFSNAQVYNNKKIIFSGLLYIAFIGFIDELIQSFIIIRNADIIDLLFDIIGGFVGLIFMNKIKND